MKPNNKQAFPFFAIHNTSSNPNKIMGGGKSSQVRYRKSCLMLAILLILFYSLGLRAQNYTYKFNAEYGNVQHNTTSGHTDEGSMFQYKVIDGAHFSATATDDPRITMTMNNVAANGYGQWTVSANMGPNVAITDHEWLFSPNQHGVDQTQNWSPNNSSAWLLLGNLIGKPSEKYDNTDPTHYPGCQPPGVVSGGKFNEPSFPVSSSLVTANLNGSVRYSAVEPVNRSSFLIEGLNDERGATAPVTGGTRGDQQINITLNGLPNPAIKRQIVQAPIFTYASASTQSGGSTHPVIPTSAEPDTRDQFFIVMDEKYEYIVWCSPNSATNNLEIWATAIYLNNGSTASGYPLKVAGAAGVDFKRPTVDCDKRNNPLLPEFGVAWITNGTVQVAVYGGTAYTGPKIVQPISGVPETLPAIFHDPFLSGTANDHSYIGAATHARILVSSVSGSYAPVYSVYVLEGPLALFPGFDHDFILYKGLNFNPGTEIIATYVDGLQNTGGGASYPPPATPATFTLKGIKDQFITGFANPYDNQNLTNGYNQYHCLYQPLYQNNSTNVFINPLVILRGFDNGFANAGTPDTRLLLNQTGTILEDPTSYCAAVNQMGVHIHWRSNGTDGMTPTHYYVRDIRVFDEPIEEHTLLTNKCMVADGTSHGGTSGALLEDGVKMTIWSDPNYGAVNGGSTTSGMYKQYPGTTASDGIFFAQANIGSLTYSTTGLALTVGSSSGAQLANLYTMPVCNIAKNSSAGSITINPGSTWDYYGSSSFADWNSYSPALTINITGVTNSPAMLNIHGGATFWECYDLESKLSTINILNDPNIFPIQDPTQVTACEVKAENSCSTPMNKTGINCPANGLLRISTTTTIDQSKINSFIPIRDWIHNEGPDPENILLNVIMMITTQNATESSSRHSLFSTNNHYTNYESFGDVPPGGAGAVILYDGRRCSDDAKPDKVVFDHDNFTRIQFHAYSPGLGGLEVTHSTIDDWDLFPIYVENGCEGCSNGCSTSNYADIKIENNTFENVLGSPCGQGFDVAPGILIRNFNTTGKFSQVNVNGNHFDYYVSLSGHSLPTDYSGLVEAAIELDNSTANVENNTITEDLFATGIRITSTAITGTPMTHSYLCNNTLTDLNGSLVNSAGTLGIESDNYDGYVNLCTITNCGIGYISGENDNPSIVHSSIINSKSSGIFINGGGAFDFANVDLTGIHGGSTNHDFAANNVITNNGTYSSEAQIMLADNNQKVDLGRLVSSWGSWGLNKIIATTSTPKLIATGITTMATIGSIDNNHWEEPSGTTIDPHTLLSPPSTNFSVNYTSTTGGSIPNSVITIWRDSSDDFSCSGYSGSEHISKRTDPLTIPIWSDTCAHLKEFMYGMPSDQAAYKLRYDTLRLYIEHCAVSDSTSWRAFQTITAAVQYMSTDSTRFDQYRAWLISVIYLNKIQPQYFCACLGSIERTFQYGKYKGTGTFAVEKYVRYNHPECWGGSDDKHYQSDSISLVRAGYDLEHLPSLDSLGLGFLVDHNSTGPSPILLPSQYLASFTSNPNPFKNETTLDFTLNRMAYIQVAVYDDLGRLVWGDGKGSSLEAGKHTIQIEGSKLPRGTLYARISTGFGEVKTVKLIHEK